MIQFNGTDVTSWFNKFAISPGLNKVEGPNSGVSMGGTAILDQVTVKAEIALETNALTEAQYLQLLQLCSNPTITVVTDLFVAGGATYSMIPTMTPGTRVPFASGAVWYTGAEVGLVEQ